MNELLKKIKNRKKTKKIIIIIFILIFIATIYLFDLLKMNDISLIIVILEFIMLMIVQAVSLNIVLLNLSKEYRKIINKELEKEISLNTKKTKEKNIFDEYVKLRERITISSILSGTYKNLKFDLYNVEITKRRDLITYDFESPHTSYNKLSLFSGSNFIFDLDKQLEETLIFNKNCKFYKRFIGDLERIKTDIKELDNNYYIYGRKKLNINLYKNVLKIFKNINDKKNNQIMLHIKNDKLYLNINSGFQYFDITEIINCKEEKELENIISIKIKDLTILLKLINDLNESVKGDNKWMKI